MTAPDLAAAIQTETGQDALAFFDAIAPIIHTDSIDMDIAWYQSRYDKVGPGGTGKDYINCPLDEAQYNAFIDALIAGDTTDFKEWEGTPYFDGCLPIEVMAERGRETLRHGPMKPMGLTNAHKPEEKPYAVVQLRQDNALGTLYNMVGFQTKLRYAAQIPLSQGRESSAGYRFARHIAVWFESRPCCKAFRARCPGVAGQLHRVFRPACAHWSGQSASWGRASVSRDRARPSLRSADSHRNRACPPTP